MEECIFCKIVRKEIPSKLEYEDDLVIAFHDINPKAPFHLLVIPKKHLVDLREASLEDEAQLARLLLTANKLAEKLNFLSKGYKIVIRNGAEVGQEVMHLHMHVLSS